MTFGHPVLELFSLAMKALELKKRDNSRKRGVPSFSAPAAWYVTFSELMVFRIFVYHGVQKRDWFLGDRWKIMKCGAKGDLRCHILLNQNFNSQAAERTRAKSGSKCSKMYIQYI